MMLPRIIEFEVVLQKSVPKNLWRLFFTVNASLFSIASTFTEPLHRFCNVTAPFGGDQQTSLVA